MHHGLCEHALKAVHKNMNQIDIFSFGWAYELILLALFIVFVVDSVSIIVCLKKGQEDIKEYAELCVKYLKILMCFFAGIFLLIVAFTYGYDFTTSLIHCIIGCTTLIDAVACLIIKLRFGRK